MSQKRSTLLIWAAVIFILIVTCLITDRNNLAERTLYSSQEEMQSALQDTFVYYTARGERQAWSIHGDTAIQTYENGAVFSYTITKWHPQRGALTLTLDTTTQKENLFVALNGSLFDQHKHVFRREEQLASSDRSAKRKPVSGQNQPATQNNPPSRVNLPSRVSLLKQLPPPYIPPPNHRRSPNCPIAAIMKAMRISWMTGMAICRMAVMQRITGRIGKNGMQKGVCT